MKRSLLLAISIGGLTSCSSGGTMNPETCTNISGVVEKDGLAIRKPEEEAAGCREKVISSGIDPVSECEPKAELDLSCVGAAEPFGTPVNVTFMGCVASFGLEAQSSDLSVAVIREYRPGGTVPADPGYDVMGEPDAQAENTPDAFIGKTVSTLVEASECQDLGAFSIANVPTETNLIVRVTEQHLPKSNRRYVDAFQYNVVLRNALVRMGPMKDSPIVADPVTYCATNACYVIDEVNTINKATFRTVAIAAGVSNVRGDDDLYDGDGQGHLAGEVQDCTSVDTIQNAVVSIDAEARKLAYFNVGFPPDGDNLADPKVEGTRQRTNGDGLYAAIAVDVPSGGKPVKAGAAITTDLCGNDGVCACLAGGMKNPAYTVPDEDEGTVRVLGTRSVYVYPDSITIFTFDRAAYVTR